MNKKRVWFCRICWKTKKDNEVDLDVFFDVAENKIMYNHVPVNSPIEDLEELMNAFCTNGYFTLDDEGEIDFNRVFRDITELASFIDKILD